MTRRESLVWLLLAVGVASVALGGAHLFGGDMSSGAAADERVISKPQGRFAARLSRRGRGTTHVALEHWHHADGALARGTEVTWRQAAALWRSSLEFAAFCTELLAQGPEAMYWETPPVTAQSSKEPFEFVMIDSLQLRHAAADADTFSSHFRPCALSAVVTFPNLGHDATLVVPCPADDTPLDSYTHIAAFMRGAPPEQVLALWAAVGEAVEGALGEQPLWVSTSGLGVYWLHVRLDSYPKYYQHAPYKNAAR